MTAAAFQATYADWRVIRSRKVVSISFEVPIEQADLAYQVVGGMPNPAVSEWFAIARLNQKGGDAHSAHAEHDKAQPFSHRQPREARHWDDLPPAQQAGILCNEKSFDRFLIETMDSLLPSADFVRQHCGVSSRSDIERIPAALRLWRDLVSDYRAWMREVEIVG